ncbi:MAG: hypothetical protein ABR905_11070 [Terracidiphilus sp.]
MALGKNGAVYLVCALIGLGTAHFLPGGWWSIFAYLLITYHLYLGYHVIISEHETGFSLPVGSTIITHLACVSLVVCFALGRGLIPFFGLIRLFVPALAPFEAQWLFSGKKSNSKNKPVPISKEKAAQKAAAVADAVAATATVDDYEEWLRYLAQPNRPPRKPGVSVQDEYKQWLVARARAKVTSPKQ